MEDSATKCQSGKSTSRLLRYPLRSSNKPKEEKAPLKDASNNSASKRGMVVPSVSKSVGVLDLSGKMKSSSKPPRRLSVPSKSPSPAPKSLGIITPISEARAKRSTGHQGKSDTPLSNVSNSSHRRKFNALSSTSYWLSQIKLSESAAKHSISLGFFKLALEAGCEPMQRMSDELKAYIQCHNLSEHGEFVKELVENYKISETIDQSQGSQNCSQDPPVEGNQVSDDDDVNSSSSSVTAEKPKPNPNPPGINVAEIQSVRKANQEATQKDNSTKKTSKPMPRNMANSKSGSETRGQRKPKKQSKQESAAQGKNNKVKQGDKSSPCEEGTPTSPPVVENKENMDYVGEVAVA